MIWWQSGRPGSFGLLKTEENTEVMNKRMRVITMMVMLLILVAVTRAEAEDGDFVWAKSMGGPYAVSVATAITVDASGNIYTTGGFSGTVDFDPGPGTFNLTAAGNRDIFLSKLDSAGNFLWVSNMGGSNSCSGIRHCGRWVGERLHYG